MSRKSLRLWTTVLTEQRSPKQIEPPTVGNPTTGDPNLNAGTKPNPTDDSATQNNDTASADQEPRTISLSKQIASDGKGPRRVRIEYDDAQGTHTPIDEMHGEGDVVSQKVDVYGSKITVRVYYGDESRPVSEATRTLKRR